MKITTKTTNTIKETMAIIDQNALGMALVVDENNNFQGLVTDGDIRRAILEGKDIKDRVIEITNLDPIILKQGKFSKSQSQTSLTDQDIKKITPAKGFLRIPEIDKENKVKDLKFIDPATFKPTAKTGPVKKVLIIGGAGYLGSVLSRKLLNSGYQVRVFDNLTYQDEGIRELIQNKSSTFRPGIRKVLDKDFEFLKGDIRNISDISDAVEGVDVVIHLAAIVGDPASSIDPKKTIEINYLSAKTIAEVCKFHQVNRFLFASTCSVYGANKTPEEQLKEDSHLNPVSLYARMKLESEKGVLSLCDSNFSPTIFRFATLYGVSPRMRFDLVINLLTAKAIKDKKFAIFGGEQWRPNLEVSDAALAITKWLEAPIEKVREEIFNVGSNEQNHQIIEIGNMIKKIVPKAEMEIKYEEADPRDYNVCFDKASNVLGFRPKKTIEKGIIEIKNLIEQQAIQDFNNPKYNNYNFLSEIRNVEKT